MGRAVACMGAARNAYCVLVEHLEGKWSLEKHNISGQIILQWTLEKQHGMEVLLGLPTPPAGVSRG
jgi:hypothetical protein